MIIGLVAVFLNDRDAVFKDGFFQGYHMTTWIVISLQVRMFWQMTKLVSLALHPSLLSVLL